MNEEMTFKMVDENGKEKECEVLFTFEDQYEQGAAKAACCASPELCVRRSLSHWHTRRYQIHLIQ